MSSRGPIINLEPHPIALRYPWSEEACARMVKDIERDRQRVAIVLYEGKILDGRHRYEACVRLGRQPLTREFGSEESDGSSPTRFAHSMNTERRHLSGSQLAALAAEAISEDARAEAKARQADGQRSGGEFGVMGGRGNNKPSPPRVEERVSGAKAGSRDSETVAKVAKEFDVSRSMAYRAQAVKRAAPEVFERVKSGELSVYAAEREAGIAPSQNRSDEDTKCGGDDAAPKLRRGQHPPDSPRMLVAREREERVRELLAQGMRQREVAESLGIHPTSVSLIVERLGLKKGDPLRALVDAVDTWGSHARMWNGLGWKDEYATATQEQVDEFKKVRRALDSALDKFTNRLVGTIKEG